jgi:hypothetical protein
LKKKGSRSCLFISSYNEENFGINIFVSPVLAKSLVAQTRVKNCEHKIQNFFFISGNYYSAKRAAR